MRIFITGGHLTPALAIIEQIKINKPDWEIFFIGREYAFDKEKIIAYEKEQVEKLGVTFLPIVTGRMRSGLIDKISSLYKIISGLTKVREYLVKYKPSLIISFGGYVALPVSFMAWISGVTIVTHEQTMYPGIANQIIGIMAKKICISFSQAKKFFPSNKTVVTGLPIRSVLFESQKKVFQINKKFPIIYITGGSTGAVVLNELCFPLISKLTKKYTVIHQTGEISFEKASKISESLCSEEKKRYFVKKYFYDQEVAWILQNADLVISRSGANTISELLALGKISILVPLDWFGKEEQMANAKYLEEAGSAIIMKQSESTSDSLYSNIENIFENKEHYQFKAKELSVNFVKNGASRVFNEVLTAL